MQLAGVVLYSEPHFFWHCAYQENSHLSYLVSQQVTEEAWLAAENVLKKGFIFSKPWCRHAIHPLGIFTFINLCQSPPSGFLAPGVNDTMNGEMMMLYQFLFRVLHDLAEYRGLSPHCLVPKINMADGSLHEFFPV